MTWMTCFAHATILRITYPPPLFGLYSIRALNVVMARIVLVKSSC